MSIQVGPSPAQLWHWLRWVLTAPARFIRYLAAPVPSDAPASMPPLQPGFLDRPYNPSPPLMVGLAFHDAWVYTPGGVISQERAERLTAPGWPRDSAVCGERDSACKEFCRFPACLPNHPGSTP